MRKVIIITLVLSLISFAAHAEEPLHLSKKNAFSIKAGYHWYPSQGFFNDYGIDKSDINGGVLEIEYDYKFNKNITFSVPVGYNIGKEAYPALDLKGKLQAKNYYIAPTIKYYPHISKGIFTPLFCCDGIFASFIGCGFGWYYSDVDFRLDYAGSLLYKTNVTKDNLGFHLVAGLEILINKKPDIFVYDWPVSIFIENRYAWVKQKNIDNDLVNLLNESSDATFSKHDLKVGGNTLLIGLKYHF